MSDCQAGHQSVTKFAEMRCCFMIMGVHLRCVSVNNTQKQIENLFVCDVAFWDVVVFAYINQCCI